MQVPSWPNWAKTKVVAHQKDKDRSAVVFCNSNNSSVVIVRKMATHQKDKLEVNMDTNKTYSEKLQVETGNTDGYFEWCCKKESKYDVWPRYEDLPPAYADVMNKTPSPQQPEKYLVQGRMVDRSTSYTFKHTPSGNLVLSCVKVTSLFYF